MSRRRGEKRMTFPNPLLVVVSGPSGVGKSTIVAQLAPPNSPKKKFLYFMKAALRPLTLETMQTLTFGEVAPTVLEQLSTLGQEVFLPLMSSPTAHHAENLPDIVTKGVVESFQQMLASTYVTIGQTMVRRTGGRRVHM